MNVSNTEHIMPAILELAGAEKPYYDLTNDPQEQINLALQSQYETKVKELFEKLLKLQSDLNDQLELLDIYSKWL